MPKVSKHPVAVFDFTLPAEDVDSKMIIAGLDGLAKKYAFQLEESDTGYRHFQGRVSLIKKRRLGAAINLFAVKDVFSKIHLSITSTPGMGDQLYVLKEDTRVGGPWTDKDEKPLYVPRHIRAVTGLRPFQAKILEMAGEIDDRKVDVIYCPNGNKGKSVLIGKARAAGHRALPPCFDYKDILRMVHGLPTAKAYFIDMPRAIKKDKVAGFFAALETIKDGYAYDDRYSFREKTFDPPRIFLFTNKVPDLRHLSLDRWSFWTIDDSFELCAYDVPDVPVD